MLRDSFDTSVMPSKDKNKTLHRSCRDYCLSEGCFSLEMYIIRYVSEGYTEKDRKK